MNHRTTNVHPRRESTPAGPLTLVAALTLLLAFAAAPAAAAVVDGLGDAGLEDWAPGGTSIERYIAVMTRPSTVPSPTIATSRIERPSAAAVAGDLLPLGELEAPPLARPLAIDSPRAPQPATIALAGLGVATLLAGKLRRRPAHPGPATIRQQAAVLKSART